MLSLHKPPTQLLNTENADLPPLYRHGVVIELEGDYLPLLDYLQALENLPRRLDLEWPRRQGRQAGRAAFPPGVLHGQPAQGVDPCRTFDCRARFRRAPGCAACAARATELPITDPTIPPGFSAVARDSAAGAPLRLRSTRVSDSSRSRHHGHIVSPQPPGRRHCPFDRNRPRGPETGQGADTPHAFVTDQESGQRRRFMSTWIRITAGLAVALAIGACAVTPEGTGRAGRDEEARSTVVGGGTAGSPTPGRDTGAAARGDCSRLGALRRQRPGRARQELLHGPRARHALQHGRAPRRAGPSASP